MRNSLRAFGTFALASSVVMVSASLASAVPVQVGGDGCVQTVDNLTAAVTRHGNYCLIAVTGPTASSGTSGTWTVPTDVTAVDVLVVGGGGGGGFFGGGGAGAMYEGTAIAVTPQTAIDVTVGTGGSAGTSTTVAGSGGSPSSFGTVIAYGGGGGSSVAQSSGATVYSAASPGGSGGGAVASPVGPWKSIGEGVGTSSSKQSPTEAGSAAGTAGVGMRHAGGDANAIWTYFSNANYSYIVGGSGPGVGISISFWEGGGGGGAGEDGGDITFESNGLVGKTGGVFNSVVKPGTGGAGMPASFIDATDAASLGIGEVSGSDVYFAGGGGGRMNFDAASTEPKNWDYSPTDYLDYALNGMGGLGGGGGTGANRLVNGVTGAASNAGFDNTGGGGRSAAAGGSGIVVIRYLIPGSEPPVDPPVDPEDDNSRSELAETGVPSALVSMSFGIAGLLFALGITAVARSRRRPQH